MVKTLTFLSVIFGTAFISAEDLGIFGETFEIAEKNLLEEILEKLRRMAADGTMEREQKNMQKQIAEDIKRPKAVAGIMHTREPRKFEFDPTISVTRDLKDHRGRVFARKGDRFNPLDMISVSKPLLFIDGDDEDHIFWVELRLKTYPTAKVILVNGSPFEVEKKPDREIFFDQHGALTQKLGIKQVPALVYQESGKKALTVSESLALPEKFSRFPRPGAKK
jgi:conjugal transfer pilus assembly protein TraW